MKTWVLITIFFNIEGIYMMPAVEFPTMDSCFKAREIMVKNMEEETNLKAGINWQSLCIGKNFTTEGLSL